MQIIRVILAMTVFGALNVLISCQSTNDTNPKNNLNSPQKNASESQVIVIPEDRRMAQIKQNFFLKGNRPKPGTIIKIGNKLYYVRYLPKSALLKQNISTDLQSGEAIQYDVVLDGKDDYFHEHGEEEEEDIFHYGTDNSEESEIPVFRENSIIFRRIIFKRDNPNDHKDLPVPIRLHALDTNDNRDGGGGKFVQNDDEIEEGDSYEFEQTRSFNFEHPVGRDNTFFTGNSESIEGHQDRTNLGFSGQSHAAIAGRIPQENRIFIQNSRNSHNEDVIESNRPSFTPINVEFRRDDTHFGPNTDEFETVHDQNHGIRNDDFQLNVQLGGKEEFHEHHNDEAINPVVPRNGDFHFNAADQNDNEFLNNKPNEHFDQHQGDQDNQDHHGDSGHQESNRFPVNQIQSHDDQFQDKRSHQNGNEILVNQDHGQFTGITEHRESNQFPSSEIRTHDVHFQGNPIHANGDEISRNQENQHHDHGDSGHQDIDRFQANRDDQFQRNPFHENGNEDLANQEHQDHNSHGNSGQQDSDQFKANQIHAHDNQFQGNPVHHNGNEGLDNRENKGHNQFNDEAVHQDGDQFKANQIHAHDDQFQGNPIHHNGNEGLGNQDHNNFHGNSEHQDSNQFKVNQIHAHDGQFQGNPVHHNGNEGLGNRENKGHDQFNAEPVHQDSDQFKANQIHAHDDHFQDNPLHRDNNRFHGSPPRQDIDHLQIRQEFEVNGRQQDNGGFQPNVEVHSHDEFGAFQPDIGSQGNDGFNHNRDVQSRRFQQNENLHREGLPFSQKDEFHSLTENNNFQEIKGQQEDNRPHNIEFAPQNQFIDEPKPQDDAIFQAGPEFHGNSQSHFNGDRTHANSGELRNNNAFQHGLHNDGFNDDIDISEPNRQDDDRLKFRTLQDNIEHFSPPTNNDNIVPLVHSDVATENQRPFTPANNERPLTSSLKDHKFDDAFFNPNTGSNIEEFNPTNIRTFVPPQNDRQVNSFEQTHSQFGDPDVLNLRGNVARLQGDVVLTQHQLRINEGPSRTEIGVQDNVHAVRSEREQLLFKQVDHVAVTPSNPLTAGNLRLQTPRVSLQRGGQNVRTRLNSHPLELENPAVGGHTSKGFNRLIDSQLNSRVNSQTGIFSARPLAINSGRTETTAHDDDFSVIPGTAGVHFPILSQVPETIFSCSAQQASGFYADVDADCQVFHVCDFNNVKKSFLCPNGTLFNQRTFVCEWWYNVNCQQSTQFYGLNFALYGQDVAATSISSEDTRQSQSKRFNQPKGK